MSKLKLATVWLDGCSGCHMSFLDMDERLIELAALVDVVYSPIVDAKQFPDEVDIALVEGAVASVDDEKKIKKIRAHSKLLVAMGDCAVAGNVPSMRNPIGRKPSSKRAYIENADVQQQIPCVVVPQLLRVVRPDSRVCQGGRLLARLSALGRYLPCTALTALVTGEPLDITGPHPFRSVETRSLSMSTDDHHRSGYAPGRARQNHHSTEDQGQVEDANFHVTQVRGFERFSRAGPTTRCPA
jgi:NAD-reducing hydrogenase small subunit